MFHQPENTQRTFPLFLKNVFQTLSLCWQEVDVVADGLLHAALKCFVGGGDGQEEAPGLWPALGEQTFIAPFLLRFGLCRFWMVKEGDGRRG